jgi:CHASE3 domain sensor protein
MKQTSAKTDTDQRRAAARRTAWIVAIVAVAIYLLFFLSQWLSH